MALIALTREGTAWLVSKEDKRWNYSVSCSVGGFVMPDKLEKKIEELKELYGTPPKDLEWGYMKD